MPSGKQITALFAVAALGAGLGIAGHQQVEKHKWRAAVSAYAKPELVDLFLDAEGANGRDAPPPLGKTENCVIDSFTNAVADYISPDPAGLTIRAAREIKDHNEVAALRRTAAEISRGFETGAASCLALAKSPIEREHAITIKNWIGQNVVDYRR